MTKTDMQEFDGVTGHLQLEGDPEMPGDADQGGDCRLVIAGFKTGYSWLAHPQPTRQSGLGQLVVNSIPDDQDGQLIGQRGAGQLGRYLGIAGVLICQGPAFLGRGRFVISLALVRCGKGSAVSSEYITSDILS